MRFQFILGPALAFSVMLSACSSSGGGSGTAGVLQTQSTLAVEGQWKMSSRICSSGARVKDGINPARGDQVVVQFRSGKYRYDFSWKNRQAWQEGDYTLFGRTLTTRPIRAKDFDGTIEDLRGREPVNVTVYSDQNILRIVSSSHSGFCPSTDQVISQLVRIGD